MTINNMTFLYGPTKWIVDPVLGNGTHTTIQAAINAASSGDAIAIRPGTYTQNLTVNKSLTFFAFSAAGVRAESNSVIINGSVTITSAGLTVGFNGISHVTNGTNILNFSQASGEIIFNSCRLACLTNTGIFCNGSGGNVYLNDCNGTFGVNVSTQTLFATSSTNIWISNCLFVEATGGIPAQSPINGAATIYVVDSWLNFPIIANSTSTLNIFNTVFGNVNLTQNVTYIQTTFQSTAILSGCNFYSGSSSSVSIGTGTTVTATKCDFNSSATNVLTGLGTLKYGFLTFSGSSSGVNVSTQTSLETLARSALSINVQTFTSTGTYTPTSGMVYCIIECVGGGGGGGGADSAATTVAGGAGGGGGGYARIKASASTIGASQTVTIGAAGAAGAAGNNAGGNGGTSSVGSIVSATGGTGGNGGVASQAPASTGGAGGTGSSGNINLTGQTGGPSSGFYVPGVITYIISGCGGNSFFGYGAPSLMQQTASGIAGVSYGSGGSGGAQSNNGGTQTGGAGSAGVVVITEFIFT